MTSKDTKEKTKTSLMDELKSIKGILNSDDDNVPLLIDDEDVPLLVDDEDIPVLVSDDDAADKASLNDALRQLESMELAPKSNKTRPATQGDGLEEKIRSNAAAPLFNDPKFDDKATTVRENPFLTKKPVDHFAASRKQAEDALQSVIAHSRAMSQPSAPTAPKEPPPKKAIEFSATEKPVATSAKTTSTSASAIEEDGSEAILKLLGEEHAIVLDLGDDFDDLVDIDVDAMINEKATPAKTSANKPNEKQINAIVDEVVDEYMIILEAALRKKLKEKLPDLLKK